MAVHLLDSASLAGAVRQLVTNKDFRAKNQHLSQRDYRALLSSPPVWSEFPVFSPYAATHGEYSQIRIGSTKYLVHRVTYAAFYGGIKADEDISHIMYIGTRTTRNINPRHLVQESNEINQGRKLCFQYMESLVRRWSVGAFGHPSWSDDEFRRFLLESNGPCALLDSRRCDCCVVLWVLSE